MTLVQPTETQSPEPILAPAWGEIASLMFKAGYGGEHVRLIKANMTRFTGFLDELAGKENPLLTADWLDKLVEAEQKLLKAFFGREFDLTFFRQILAACGQEKLKVWAALGLEPHYFPSYLFTADLQLPGWKVKPNNWYWEQQEAGNFYLPGPTGLVQMKETRTVESVLLTDMRGKPGYNGGKQLWKSDKPLLGKAIERLRKDRQISEYSYGPQSSRFGVSATEVDNHLIQAFADVVGLEASQVRLERAIEANVLSQIHTGSARAKDGGTDTWLWYQESFGSAAVRVFGGYSGGGGLADVYWHSASHSYNNGSFRLQGVLGTQVPGT